MANYRTDEILRHFDLVAEAVQGQIAQVGEGVVLSNERLGRIEARLDRVESRLDRVETRSEALESEMRAGFAEVKSMIKLSYVELEGRMSSLERELLDLRSRVQKLETRA